ncbi:hypothetical protein [Neotamlana laminarinivorans]|uniref:TonB family protein n=1 Tax=Neotamlana laminarinivorans TaxID=2883124 RepID=A0A9X1I0Z5_9FLAO|nr:hypothetical protein [Tamlana laminarinivorans]MCB4799804.1 hypothetical protein [Tamlana laminarinivorans]
MTLTDQHKALIITFLLSGVVVFCTFIFGLKQQELYTAESYYELEPEEYLPEDVNQEIKALEESSKNSEAETNNAFNEAKQNEHFAQAFKTIAPPEDYVPDLEGFDAGPNTSKLKYSQKEAKSLNKDELDKFSKVNELLKKQQDKNNNAKSTISFSLKDRSRVHIPIPVYLCEENGKIVVNITVNGEGHVTDTYINNSSTSENQCLKEKALEYAKQSVFSADASKQTQIGTITFNFIGK